MKGMEGDKRGRMSFIAGQSRGEMVGTREWKEVARVKRRCLLWVPSGVLSSERRHG